MQPNGESIVLGPGEGTIISVMGNELLTKASNEATGGKLWVMEYTVEPGFAGPPPHVHHRTHEIYYVLEGELGLRLDDRNLTLAAGSFVLVTPGTLHSFHSSDDRPCRYMSILSPGDIEGYFLELPDIVAKHGYPPPPEIMGQLGAKFDIESRPDR